MAADWEFTPLVRRLGCLRGIGTLTGFALAVEIGDWHRFTGNTIGSFVGLVPSEYSSGQLAEPGIDHQDRQQPRPAAAGRGRLAPPSRYRVGKTMRDRWDLAPAAARARGDEGNRRLHARWVRFIDPQARRTPIANVAIARELAGWCWSLAVLDEGTGHQTCFVDQRPMVAARGATRDRTMSSPSPATATLDVRHADPLQPNTPSCGNQPAHISLTARRQRHAHHDPGPTKHEAPATDTIRGRASHPAP